MLPKFDVASRNIALLRLGDSCLCARYMLLLLLLLLVVVVVVVSHSLDSSSPWLTGQAPVSLEWSNTPGTKHKENQKWYLVHAYIPGK